MEQIEQIEQTDIAYVNITSEEAILTAPIDRDLTQYTDIFKRDVLHIATHNGRFHADEVCAYTMLRKLYKSINPTGKLTISRSRDEDIIATGDIVVDVGQTFDPTIFRFDHHQTTFTDNYFMTDFNVPLSSCGLIYQYFGDIYLSHVCKKLTNNDSFDYNMLTNEQQSELLCSIYRRVILEIDAGDNGIEVFEKKKGFGGAGNSFMASLVNQLNNVDTTNDENQMENFLRASELAEKVLDIQFESNLTYFMNFTPQYEHISLLLETRELQHDSDEVIVDGENCNLARACVLQYEYKNPDKQKLSFIVYCNKEDDWRVKTVGNKPFESRKLLAKEDDILIGMTTPEDFVFVHKNRFLACAKTHKSIMEIVQISLDQHDIMLQLEELERKQNLDYYDYTVEYMNEMFGNIKNMLPYMPRF
jgi:uncharacterized UPF0160 family protein